MSGIWLVSGHVLWVLFMFTQQVRTMIIRFLLMTENKILVCTHLICMLDTAVDVVRSPNQTVQSVARQFTD